MRFIRLSLLLFLLGCTKVSCNNQDIDFIYQTLLENHPGIQNELDPGFKPTLDNSYKTAKKYLQQNGCYNVSTARLAIENFINSFDDSHLQVNWNDKGSDIKNSQNESQKIEIDDIGGMSWITIPTFDLGSNPGKDFLSLIKLMPKLRNKTKIVFDLRGNQGGNSLYGSQIIDSLFGKNYAEQRRYEYEKNTYVDWRSSKDNLSYIQRIYNDYNHPIWLKDIVDGMEESFKNGKFYYREKFANNFNINHHKKLHHSVNAKIFIITDKVNFSAALNFIDELKMMQHDVVLVGAVTKSDRLYMEIRQVNLPSGLGSFIFPIKVYRNRFRDDNQPYKPDVLLEIDDTLILQEFIKSQ